jgi:hypothetical protein
MGLVQGIEAALNTLLQSALNLLALTGKLAALYAQAVADEGSRRPSRKSGSWSPACHGRSGRRSA